jgi:hypothetical protein
MAERNYKFKDSVLLEWGDTIVSYLKKDIQQFTDFDPKLNAVFLADLDNKVTQAYKEGGDQANIAQLQQKTVAVENAMAACHAHFKKLKYWVLDAFPGKKAVQKQFGIGRYKEIRNSQTRMIQYMEGLTNTINQHRETLTAAGAPAQLLDAPSLLALNLRNANTEQEQKKGARTVDTEKRIAIFNELYAILQKINAAADNVFDSQPAKRELYRTPKNTASTTGAEEEEEETSIF